MIKTINKEVFDKIIEDSGVAITVYEAEEENNIVVDIQFSDESHTAIKIAKYIPLEEASKMSMVMADQIAGEQETENGKEFVYRPYMKGLILFNCFLHFFTNVDVNDVDVELLNRIMVQTGFWNEVSAYLDKLPQIGDILLASEELVSYNNAYYLSTQVQKVEALEKQLVETLEKLENMSDFLSVFAEHYADMDKETTLQFIETANKIMAIDQNETAAKVAALVEESKINEVVSAQTSKPKAKRGRKPKKVVELPVIEEPVVTEDQGDKE